MGKFRVFPVSEFEQPRLFVSTPGRAAHGKSGTACSYVCHPQWPGESEGSMGIHAELILWYKWPGGLRGGGLCIVATVRGWTFFGRWCWAFAIRPLLPSSPTIIIIVERLARQLEVDVVDSWTPRVLVPKCCTLVNQCIKSRRLLQSPTSVLSCSSK